MFEEVCCDFICIDYKRSLQKSIQTLEIFTNMSHYLYLTVISFHLFIFQSSTEKHNRADASTTDQTLVYVGACVGAATALAVIFSIVAYFVM